MKILTIGDVTGVRSIEYLRKRLWGVRQQFGADVVIANGENVSDIRGISAADAEALLDCGIDLLTTGNHVWGKFDIGSFLDSSPSIIRPANFPPSCPGVGSTVLRVGGWRLLCINVMGVVYMDALDSPFDTVDKILERERGKYDFALLDIHAEATSEKIALAHYFDGRVQVFFGTHTHVPTADEQILPKGCGYITDLGMCGPSASALGLKPEIIAEKLITGLPCRFEPANTPPVLQGALFTLSPFLTSCVKVERIQKNL